jgi:peptidyl-prolyl cis-trans isomerase D
MTKHSDDEKPRAKRKTTEVAGWALMSLLILGLGGFGVTNFGGRISSVGQVGDVDISTMEYSQAIQTQVGQYAEQLGMQISAQELLAFGLGQDVLRGLISRAALTHEAGRIGLSVGDALVASEVVKMPEFQGVSGSFDRESYRFQLDRLNQSETEFETSIRREITVKLLQSLISGGITAPADMTERLYLWANEKRGFSVLRLAEGDLTSPLADPTEADLTAFYDAHPDLFMKAQAKRITYVSLLPQDLTADQPVDEAAVKALYDERIEEYVLPERRIVDRLVYPDQAAADAARAKLDGGASFEDLVTDRGLVLQDTELGDVEKADLGEAGEGVFAATEGAVVGPLPSNLGPAIFRVATILAAEETTFDEVRADLTAELQLDAARLAVDGRIEAIDDLLAGGATLEDLAKEEGLALATIDYVQGQVGASVIEGYAGFRDAADAVAEGDFSEAIPLEDGGLFALRLDEIVPEAPIPFAEARDTVAAAWREEALAKALSARAAEIQFAVAAGAALGAYGIVETTAKADRQATVTGAPASLTEDLFAMAEGEARVVEGAGFVAVVKLDRVLPAPTEGEEAIAGRAALAASFSQSIAADALTDFTSAITESAQVSLDQTAVDAVNASFP